MFTEWELFFLLADSIDSILEEWKPYMSHTDFVEALLYGYNWLHEIAGFAHQEVLGSMKPFIHSIP